MPAMVDREIGCFRQVFKTTKTFTANDTYAYSLGGVETQVGRKFDWYSTFLDLSTDYPTNPSPPATRSMHKDLADAAAAGHGLFIGYQMIAGYFAATVNGATIYAAKYATFDELLAGTYDAQISALFTYLFSLGVPVVVRPFWEANLPGSTFYPDNSTSSHPQPSATYVAGKFWTTTGLAVVRDIQNYKDGFAYFVNLLRTLPNAGTRFKSAYIPGANDPSAQVALGGSGTTFVNMYPGDSVCDYVGYDSYNTLSTSKYFTPEETLKGYRESDSTNRYAYDLFRTLAPTKKIIIGEINCMDLNDTNTGTPGAAVANGHSKAQWYTDFWALDSTIAPEVEKVMWFDWPGTRSTWPFESSVDALSAFQTGFQTGGTGTFHGTVPDPLDFGGDNAPDPSPDVAFPLSTQFIPGQLTHTAVHNKIHWLLNRTIKSINGYFGASFGSDGTQSVLSISSDMPATANTEFTPMVNFTGPVDQGSRIKYLFSLKVLGDTCARWSKTSDGTELYGLGGNNVSDLKTGRSAAATFRVQAANGGDGTIDAASAVHKYVKLTDQADPSSPGSGAAIFYGSSSGVKVRNSGGSYFLKPSQVDQIFGSTTFSVGDPAAFITTGTSGPILTGGVMLVWIARVTEARTSTRMSAYVLAAGATLTSGQCLGGLYDSTGTLIASTADQSTAWTTTGLKNMNWASSVAITPGTYYVALLGNGTTLPRFVGLTNSVANWSSSRFGTYGTAQTALPSTITTGSVAATGNIPVLSLT